jgi:AraC-like DNA-binding protein
MQYNEKQLSQMYEYRRRDLCEEFPIQLSDSVRRVVAEDGSGRQHFHNCLMLGKCREGSGFLHVGDSRFPFAAGDAICVPRFTPHALRDAPAETSRWTCIYVDIGRLLSGVVVSPQNFEMSRRMGDSGGYVLPEAAYPGVHELIAQIESGLRGGAPAGSAEILRGLFIALFYSLTGGGEPKRGAGEAGEAEPPRSVVIAPALEHMSERYMQRLTVRQLAEMCHMSETHFRRTFLLIMGMPPLSFLNETRIQRACDLLLLAPKKPILDISEEVGFSSVSSFNRCFSNIKGVTPREYRNRSQNCEGDGGEAGDAPSADAADALGDGSERASKPAAPFGETPASAGSADAIGSAGAGDAGYAGDAANSGNAGVSGDSAASEHGDGSGRAQEHSAD